MEMELKTSGTLPSGVTLQGAAKPEASAAVVESAKPTPSPGESVSPAGTGSPAEPAKPEKPGRAAAAAKKAERQAAERAADADARTAAAKPVVDEAAKYAEAIKSGDPDKILAAFGLDDEKLVDLYIAKHGTKDTESGTKAENDAAIAELKAEIAQFKAELVAKEVEAEKKRTEAAATASVQGHVDAIKSLAAKPENAEKYEVCNAEPAVIRSLTGGEYTSAAAIAFDVMVAVHQKEGEFITYEKALELTEAHLLEAHKGLVGGLGKLKKLGGALAKVEERKPDAKPEAVASTGNEALDRVREKFKASRPRVTNGLSVIHPTASVSAKGVTAANQRFRERVLALQQGQKTN